MSRTEARSLSGEDGPVRFKLSFRMAVVMALNVSFASMLKNSGM